MTCNGVMYKDGEQDICQSPGGQDCVKQTAVCCESS